MTIDVTYYDSEQRQRIKTIEVPHEWFIEREEVQRGLIANLMWTKYRAKVGKIKSITKRGKSA